MSNKKYRAFVFTHNNYESKHIEKYKNLKCTYICFGLEVGEEKGTPHIQGYVYFPNPRHWEPVRKVFLGADVQPAKGTPADCYNYCTKMCDFFEKGELPKSDFEKGEKGKEAWEEAWSLACAGRLNDIPKSMLVPHYRVLKQIQDEHYKPAVDVEMETLYRWQEDLIAIVKAKPHPRRIHWRWSEGGGVGKSTFALYLHQNHEAVVLNNGKSADIAHALPREPKVVVFDLSRTMEGHINYDVIEQIKNGNVFSAKYESRAKHFPKPHVIIFANFEPNYAAWSDDRYDVIKLI